VVITEIKVSLMENSKHNTSATKPAPNRGDIVNSFYTIIGHSSDIFSSSATSAAVHAQGQA
jgi:hypothetical protein